MGKLFIVFLFLNSLVLAQPLQDHSYRSFSDRPHAIVKHNTFTFLASTINDQAQYLHVKGINNDNSTRFDRYDSLAKDGMPHNFASIINCIPTPDKGVLIVEYGSFCVYAAPPLPSGDDFKYHFIKLDSMGNRKFSKFSSSSELGALSNTFYYACFNDTIFKINPITGSKTNTIACSTSSIYATASTSKKQIVYATAQNINIVDSLGIVITSSITSSTYKKIKCHKNKYYFLHLGSSALEVRDSVLNILGIVNAVPIEYIEDYDVYNDSLIIVKYNSIISRPVIAIYTASATSLNSFTIDVPHKIKGIIKDNFFNFIIEESAGYAYLQSTYGYYNSVALCNTGYSSFTDITNVTYPNDLVLKRIITDSLSENYIPSMGCYIGCYSYSYKQRLVIYNNSAQTVTTINVNHPLTGFKPLQGNPTCNNYNSYYKYLISPNSTDYNVIIPPYDSITIQMPTFNGLRDLTTTNPVIPFYYCVSQPNGKIDNNITDNSLTISLNVTNVLNHSLLSTDLLIYPNPASDNLQVSKVVNEFQVRNICGQLVLSGKKNNQINISSLSSGVYLISLEIEGSIINKKFVKE